MIVTQMGLGSAYMNWCVSAPDSEACQRQRLNCNAIGPGQPWPAGCGPAPCNPPTCLQPLNVLTQDGTTKCTSGYSYRGATATMQAGCFRDGTVPSGVSVTPVSPQATPSDSVGQTSGVGQMQTMLFYGGIGAVVLALVFVALRK